VVQKSKKLRVELGPRNPSSCVRLVLLSILVGGHVSGTQFYTPFAALYRQGSKVLPVTSKGTRPGGMRYASRGVRLREGGAPRPPGALAPGGARIPGGTQTLSGLRGALGRVVSEPPKSQGTGGSGGC
jgi:hypothetical protein